MSLLLAAAAIQHVFIIGVDGLSSAGARDAFIGKLAAAPIEKTLIILVAYRDGNGTRHGNHTTNELEVLLVFVGPVVANRELAAPVRNIDMAPTVIKALGLRRHACWEVRALPRK